MNTPNVTRTYRRSITPEEQDRLLAAADAQPGLKGLRDYALFRLWLDTGLRPVEVPALKVQNLTVRGKVPTLVVKGKHEQVREIVAATL